MSNYQRQSNRAFALTFSVVFAVIALVAWLFFDRLVVWLFVVAGILFAIAWTIPGILLPLNRIWGALALRIGTVSNFLILSLILYLIFAPLGFVFRLFHRDELRRKLEPDAESYFSPVNRQMDAENAHDLF